MEQINVQQQHEEPHTQQEADQSNGQSETPANNLPENGHSQNFIRIQDDETAFEASATTPTTTEVQPEQVVASAAAQVEDSAFAEIAAQFEPQPIESPTGALEAALPEPPISAMPIPEPPPAPKLVMPELYVQASGLRAKGVMPKDDLLIEVIIPEKGAFALARLVY